MVEREVENGSWLSPGRDRKLWSTNKELATGLKLLHLSVNPQDRLQVLGARKALVDAMQKPDLCHLSSHMTESKVSGPIHNTLEYM